MHCSKPISGAVMCLVALAVSPAAAQQPATIDGWDGIQFGMSGGEVVAAQPGMTWRGSEGTNLCANDPKSWSLLGCRLTRDQPVVIVGVAFEVSVSLDTSGRVDRIGLEFSERRSPRSRDQCLAVTQRARAAIASRFGAIGDNNHHLPNHLSHSGRVGLDPALAAKLAAPPSLTARVSVDGRYQSLEEFMRIIRSIPNHTPEELDDARGIAPLCVAEVRYSLELPEILQADTGKF